jgi:chromosome segregation ATPase
MQAERAHFSRAAILLAGFAAGALTRALANRGQAQQIAALRRSLSEVQDDFAARQTEWQQNMARVEERLEAHETRLNDLPSTGQIVAAMDELLSKTMQSLNQRLSAQADSIELLKTTVAQTDGLLERVLESLDSLRQSPEDNAK